MLCSRLHSRDLDDIIPAPASNLWNHREGSLIVFGYAFPQLSIPLTSHWQTMQ